MTVLILIGLVLFVLLILILGEISVSLRRIAKSFPAICSEIEQARIEAQTMTAAITETGQGLETALRTPAYLSKGKRTSVH